MADETDVRDFVAELESLPPLNPHPDEPAEVAKRVSDLELTVTGMLNRLEALEAKKAAEHEAKVHHRKASA